VQDQLKAWVPMCQHCQTLQHECYRLPDQVCSQCQRDKKTCQDAVVEGKFYFEILLVFGLTKS